jgi:hypothetical protein
MGWSVLSLVPFGVPKVWPKWKNEDNMFMIWGFKVLAQMESVHLFAFNLPCVTYPPLKSCFCQHAITSTLTVLVIAHLEQCELQDFFCSSCNFVHLTSYQDSLTGICSLLDLSSSWTKRYSWICLRKLRTIDHVPYRFNSPSAGFQNGKVIPSPYY